MLNIIDQLAGNDILKYELILELPWVMCLNKMLLNMENYKKAEWEAKQNNII